MSGVTAMGGAAKTVIAPAAAALVLGGLAPWLTLGSLGLAATGIYFYVQARRLVEPTLDDQ